MHLRFMAKLYIQFLAKDSLVDGPSIEIESDIIPRIRESEQTPQSDCTNGISAAVAWRFATPQFFEIMDLRLECYGQLRRVKSSFPSAATIWIQRI